jgi:rhomboid protease GluP
VSSPSPSEAPAGLRPEAPIPATWVLVVGLVVVHVVSALWISGAGEEALGRALWAPRSPDARTWVGGQVMGRLREGEWWRLFTSVLLHVDALHLFVNAASLWGLGRMLEPWLGPLRLLAWFAGGGVAGSVASWSMGLARSDGASGGAFALLGALLVVGWRERSRLAPDDRRLYGPILWAMTLVNLVVSFLLPFIDATSHLGGLAYGVAVGSLPRGPVERALQAVALGVFLGVVAFGWARS